MRSLINLANFKQLFKEEYVENVDHPRYKELTGRGYPCRKYHLKLNLEALEELYPFATVFSKRGWGDYYECFNRELPSEFKVIYESRPAVNATHESEGACQWIVVVDKV